MQDLLLPKTPARFETAKLALQGGEIGEAKRTSELMPAGRLPRSGWSADVLPACTAAARELLILRALRRRFERKSWADLPSIYWKVIKTQSPFATVLRGETFQRGDRP